METATLSIHDRLLHRIEQTLEAQDEDFDFLEGSISKDFIWGNGAPLRYETQKRCSTDIDDTYFDTITEMDEAEYWYSRKKSVCSGDCATAPNKSSSCITGVSNLRILLVTVLVVGLATISYALRRYPHEIITTVNGLVQDDTTGNEFLSCETMRRSAGDILASDVSETHASMLRLCRGELKTSCAASGDDPIAALSCLRQHILFAPQTCRNAIEVFDSSKTKTQRENWRNNTSASSHLEIACASDSSKLCRNEESEIRDIKNCLVAHTEELQSTCRAVLTMIQRGCL
uniref:Uncharacterized protein n=1 Tax=Octactis speculum TaxID=3111310 RepID=A0A7S2FYI3_9STRA|mmetsp:Transcript_33971/g.45904  ORF Transcript_33971/g.45904 Transcript_33971/m.45904 type:complete len:288 (+) Transcript_33971:63-926(+)